MYFSRMQLVVRPARPDEATQIRALMERVIAASVESSIRPEIVANVEANVALWLRRPSECLHLVAVLRGSIVGVLLVKDFWNLCSLFVDQALQRTGIGTTLVQAAIAHCKGRSPRSGLRLNAYPSAVGFYERLGFYPRGVPDTSGIRGMELAF